MAKRLSLRTPLAILFRGAMSWVLISLNSNNKVHRFDLDRKNSLQTRSHLVLFDANREHKAL